MIFTSSLFRSKDTNKSNLSSKEIVTRFTFSYKVTVYKGIPMSPISSHLELYRNAVLLAEFLSTSSENNRLMLSRYFKSRRFPSVEDPPTNLIESSSKIIFSQLKSALGSL